MATKNVMLVFKLLDADTKEVLFEQSQITIDFSGVIDSFDGSRRIVDMPPGNDLEQVMVTNRWLKHIDTFLEAAMYVMRGRLRERLAETLKVSSPYWQKKAA